MNRAGKRVGPSRSKSQPSRSPPHLTTPSSRNEVLPKPKFHCVCLECLTETPEVNPETGLPGRGRWLEAAEWERHQRRQERREVVAHTLDDARFVRDRSTEGNSPTLSRQSSYESISSVNSEIGESPPAPAHPQKTPPTRKVNFRLSALANQIHDARKIAKDESIIFAITPDPDVYSRHFINGASESDMVKVCKLDPSRMTNSVLIGYQEALATARSEANRYIDSRHPLVRQRANGLLEKVNRESTKLRKILWKEWLRQRSVRKREYVVTTDRFYGRAFQYMHSLVLGLYLMVATLHYLPGLSLNACGFVLRCLSLVLKAFATQCEDPELKAAAAKGLPVDFRTVSRILEVEPSYRAYVTCPTCCNIYPLETIDGVPLPNHCTYTFQGKSCDTPLRKKRKRAVGEIQLPVREFLYQDFSSYLARLYSRPDLQPYLYKNPIPSHTNPHSDNWDIWDAPCLRRFRGPDNAIFVDSPEGESHLIFSLNMDGLNPFGSRESGKKSSIGAIYMICLNLPPSIRYNVENIYLVGIIPGPHSPSNDQINYFLKPLVDELLALWNKGYTLTRTSRYVTGCLVKAAVVPLVCDLPAARQMAGFAHYASTFFCSDCKQKKKDINNIDYETWKPRTWAEHLAAAKLWKDAETQGARDKIRKKYGVRWSELLRLPYWNPTRFTVIDSMHAFYLRIVQHHCRDVWGMDVEFDDGDGITFDALLEEPSEDEMRRAYEILHRGTDQELGSLTQPVVRQLCMQLSLSDHRASKEELLVQLRDYRKGLEEDFTPVDAPEELGDYSDSDSDSGSSGSPSAALTFHEGSTFKSAEDIDHFFLAASKGKLNALRKADLLLLYRAKTRPSEVTSVDLGKMKNPQLVEHITAKRFELGIVDEEGNLLSTATRKETRVLGRETLAEIRADMQRMIHPTRMDTAHQHPGERKWGKFTADQWRAFCLVHLPLTLIRLWGNKPADSIERRRLDNFMHLATAVKLATLRKINRTTIKQYKYHMHEYLKTLLDLYPNTSITPYQHMALHFDSHLERFGPTHAWRCFPFERYNFILQNFDHNQRSGDLEKTLFGKFCGAQSLRAYFHSDILPEGVSAILESFRHTFEAETRGTRTTDVLYYDEVYRKVEEREIWDARQTTELTDVEFDLLKQWVSVYDCEPCRLSNRVFERSAITRLGDTFASIHHSESNSGVILRDIPNYENDWTAGHIQKIFSHRRTRQNGEGVVQTFAIVQHYTPLQGEERKQDAYERYPISGGRVYRNKLTPVLTLVAIEDIYCQYASIPFHVDGIREGCVAILPLNKE